MVIQLIRMGTLKARLNSLLLETKQGGTPFVSQVDPPRCVGKMLTLDIDSETRGPTPEPAQVTSKPDSDFPAHDNSVSPTRRKRQADKCKSSEFASYLKILGSHKQPG